MVLLLTLDSQYTCPLPLTVVTLVTLLKDKQLEHVRLMEPGQDLHLLAELVNDIIRYVQPACNNDHVYKVVIIFI